MPPWSGIKTMIRDRSSFTPRVMSAALLFMTILVLGMYYKKNVKCVGPNPMRVMFFAKHPRAVFHTHLKTLLTQWPQVLIIFCRYTPKRYNGVTLP